MNKVGVADYGLNVWDGSLYSYEERLNLLHNIGFEGIERLEANNAWAAVDYSSTARRLGMEFATVRGSNWQETLRLSAAFSKEYIWCESSEKDFDSFCRQAVKQSEIAGKFGVKVGLHNHLGLTVETMEQTEQFLKNCPDCGLILDVGHLTAAKGDPIYFIENYNDRICAVHLKDFVYKDKTAQYWWDQLRFCELGAGEMGKFNSDIIKALIKSGYNGWIFVEHDTHLGEPKEDLIISREFIRNCGI